LYVAGAQYVKNNQKGIAKVSSYDSVGVSLSVAWTKDMEGKNPGLI
jgi:hypothetical protein